MSADLLQSDGHAGGCDAVQRLRAYCDDMAETAWVPPVLVPPTRNGEALLDELRTLLSVSGEQSGVEHFLQAACSALATTVLTREPDSPSNAGG
ncbi:MAG: hypothetical protein WBF53_08585 [Litorimonas sp.]